MGTMMNRRQFLQLAAAAVALPAVIKGAFGMKGTRREDLQDIRTRWRDLLPEDAEVPRADDSLQRSKEEWREALPADRFRILFQEGTEPAGSSELNDEHRAGVFACAACGLPLFTSEMKFESGTGWPSFFTYIPESLETKRDFKLIWPRTEYHCIRCGGHQGHVFDDGPPPTGKRNCNNGLALRFLPADGSAS